MLTRLLLITAVAICAVSVVGCGGPSAAEQSRDAYVVAVNEARSTLLDEVRRLDDQAEPTATPASDAEALAAYERAVAEVRRALGAANVPPEVVTEHRALLAALRGYEVVIASARTANSGKRKVDVTKVRADLDAGLARSSAEIDGAVAAIRRKLLSP